MIVAKIFFWIIGIMFFAGMAGSALVIILASIEDAKELRGDKEDEGSANVMRTHPFDSAPVDPARHG